MYGSLTAIVLLMLWLYFCIYILFLGGVVNHYIRHPYVDL
jgi:membrane protein